MLFVGALGAAAQEGADATRAFYRGRELFDQQDYAGAVKAYEAGLGPEASPEFLFNLGTAALCAGDDGRALFYLRLAQRLAPRDEDIAKNLAVARSRAVDDIPRPKPNPLIATILVLHEKTTPREAFALFTLLFIAGMALLHVRLVTGRGWFGRVAAVLIVIGLSFAVSAASRRDLREHEGVILDREVGVFSGPDELTYQVFFKLHAGAEVEILDDLGDWVKIAVAGKKGYIPAPSIAQL